MRRFRSSIAVSLAIIILCGCSKESRKARINERADRYFSAGEYDKAKIEYLNLLRLDQTNAAAFQRLGFIWLEQGVPLRAIAYLLRARELSSKDPTLRVKLAQAFAALGEPDEARKEVISSLELDPTNSDAIVMLGKVSFRKDDIAATEKILGRFPNKNTAAYHLAAANLSIQKGDYGAASDEIHQALTVEPNSAQAHFLMGQVFLLRKNPDHASPELKAAAELARSPRSSERLGYAQFLAATGATDEARNRLQALTKQAPDYIPAWRELAQLAVREKKYDDARSLLENIFSRDPLNPEARIIEASILVAKGKSDEAVVVLDKLNSTYPDVPMVKFQLARAYVANKNMTQATSVLEQTVSLKPDFIDAVVLLGEINLRAGKLQQVVAAMEPLHAKFPELPQPRVLLADAYRALGRQDDAAALFREQLERVPQSSADHFLLGVMLREQQKTAEARNEFEKTLDLSPDAWRAVDQLVELDLADKNYESAAQHARRYIEKNPAAAPGHFLLGKTAAAQQHWTEAESELHQALDIDPNFSFAYDALLSVYVAQKKLPQAIAELEATLQKKRDDPRTVMILALLYEQVKDYPKAVDAYEKVIAAKPDMITALNNLAYVYTERLPQLDRAYELAQKARTLQPDDPSVADTLGWALYKKGEYQQALALFQESAAKVPKSPTIQFHLGMAASMMGQADTAHAAFERALALNADFPEKEETQRRLAALRSGTTNPGEPASSDVVALTRRAEDSEKNGKPAEAAAAYEEAFRQNPKLTDVALKLTQLYAGPLQRPDKGMEYARKARALAPNNAAAAAVLGHVAIQAGNFAWSYTLLQEATRQRRDDTAALYDLAIATYALGKVPEARHTMQQLISLAPNSPQIAEANQFLKFTALDQPSPEATKVEPEVAAALKTHPDDVPALMVRAAIQLQGQDTKDAAATYGAILQKYPDFAPAQKHLAAIYVSEPNGTAKAYDLAMKARRTLADEPDLARILGEISFQRNDYAYAIQLFEQSAKDQPLGAKDLYYLGVAQIQTKQLAKGRETLRRAIAAGLQDPFVEEAKKRLAEQPPK